MSRIASTVDATPYIDRIRTPTLGLYPEHAPVTIQSQEQTLKERIASLRIVHVPSRHHTIQNLMPATLAQAGSPFCRSARRRCLPRAVEHDPETSPTRRRMMNRRFPLAAGACCCCGVCGADVRLGAKLSEPAGPPRRAVSGRRPRGCAGPRARRSAEQDVGPAGDHRKPRRRRRQSWRGGGRTRCSGRLHAAAQCIEPCHQCEPVRQAAIRSDQGLHAGLGSCVVHAGAGRAPVRSRDVGEGIRRLREKQAGWTCRSRTPAWGRRRISRRCCLRRPPAST